MILRQTARGRTRGIRGITLLEVLIGVGLLALVFGNIYMVLGRSAKTYTVQTDNAEADAHVRRTLDRITMALVGADYESLFNAMQSPLAADEINYRTCLGVNDGLEVWSDPQRIAMTVDKGRQVTWFEDPGEVDQRRVAWSNWVREWFAGEVPNGIDDNGNGLTDEAGLSFDVEGKLIRIQLTIEKPGPDGKTIVRKLESKVTCRN